MTAFRVSEAEQDILKRSDISHAAKLLYLIGLRPNMDFRTGIVGKVRRISYQSLHEMIEFIPPPGSQRPKGDYSVKALRCLIAELERAGLVRRLPNDLRSLFLECWVADREDASKNRKGRGRAESKGIGAADLEASNGYGFDDFDEAMKGRPDEGRKGTPPVSGKPSVSQTPTQLTRAVDNFGAGVLLVEDEIVDWLKAAEKRRGKIMVAARADEHIKSWVSKGVRTEELATAHAAAVAEREKRGSEAVINTGFLNVFVTKEVAQRKAWFECWSGIVLKGESLGLYQSPNEQNQSFKARVFAAAGVSEDEARLWQA